MNTSTFLAVFPRQLRYWTLHCLLNSAPSFCIALITLQMWQSPRAIAAMLCAIATFILLYAATTSAIDPLANEKHVLSRSLKLGTKIRAWISGLSLLVVWIPPTVFWAPDFWCGFLAASLTDNLMKTAGGMEYFFSGAARADFLPIYMTTMFEGFILSFILMMISFFAVICLQARDRKRLFSDPAFCRLAE